MKRLLNATTVVVASALLLAGCGGGGSDDPPAPPPVEMPDPAIAERNAIDMAIGNASDAVGMVNNDATDAMVAAADAAITAARNAIAAAANVPAEEKAANTGTVDALASRLDAAKTARQMAMDDAQDAADAAMMALAEKLHAGISVPTGDVASPDSRLQSVLLQYGGTNDAQYTGERRAYPLNAPAANASLSEDKDAVVAALHGWEGKKYTRTMPASGGTYEAYRLLERRSEPTEGRMFGSFEPGTGDNRAFEYMLVNGVLNEEECRWRRCY